MVLKLIGLAVAALIPLYCFWLLFEECRLACLRKRYGIGVCYRAYGSFCRRPCGVAWLGCDNNGGDPWVGKDE